MHAWAEVNHDLLYKPQEGELSDQERALLDQLNGLVMTGEISLEQLQGAREARVAEKDGKIANHYDLATYLLSHAAKLTDKPIGDSGLGRVDVLFDFIAESGLDTPRSLESHFEAIHENFELRPLAEQIVDSFCLMKTHLATRCTGQGHRRQPALWRRCPELLQKAQGDRMVKPCV